jgi:pantoate--beta-alanine ligase
MQIFTGTRELKDKIFFIINEEKKIGFVPTMGALHKGHISLIKRALKENDITVCSIFVNPNQFNNKNDLLKYPRTLEKDLNLLDKAGCNIVFTPSVEEIYPEPDTRVFDFGILDKVMEGKFRAGHFNGVAQVVSRLFDIVKPHKSYFGEKDFQQLAVIKSLTKQLNLPVEIVACPIVRENDGLAMSSRNKLLSGAHRKSSTLISETLFRAVEKRNLPLEELKKWVIQTINSDINLKVEYFEIVDFDSLHSLSNWDDSIKPIGCIAVFAGEVRLIDNIRFF